MLATLVVVSLVAAASAVAVAVMIARAPYDPTEEPRPFTHDHPRCQEVARKLSEAREAMRARGTPLLLVDRKAWQRVSGGPALRLVERR